MNEKTKANPFPELFGGEEIMYKDTGRTKTVCRVREVGDQLWIVFRYYGGAEWWDPKRMQVVK